MKKFLLATLTCMVSLSMLAGCSKSKPNVDTAKIDLLARKLLTSISQNKASEFYKQNFAPSFKDRISEKDWQNMSDRYMKHLGTMMEMDRYSTRLEQTEYTTEASCAFYVKWEKEDGKLEPSLTKEGNQDWQIVSLNISSKKIADIADLSKNENLDEYKKEAESMAAQKTADINTAAPSIPTGEEKDEK